MSDRTKAQQRALEICRDYYTEWYMQESNGIPPTCWVEDKLPAHGVIQHYMEPPLLGIDNPVIVEGYIGDRWMLRTEKRKL